MDLYLPLALTAAQLNDRADHDYMVVGRRAAVTVKRREARNWSGIAARLRKMYPATNLGWSVKVEPLLDKSAEPLRPLYMRLMMGGTCLCC